MIKSKNSIDEKEILKSFEEGQWESIGNLDNKRKEYSSYASNALKKNKRINIRLNEKDLELIQNIAVDEGIPYQTLISSLLHKYVNGKLIEKTKASFNTEDSQQEHEIKYLLKKYNKSQSTDNQKIMRQIIIEFKKSKGAPYTKSYKRDKFDSFAKKNAKFKMLNDGQK